MVTEYVITVIIGLLVGSFLNVCIYRIPKDMSIHSPSRSFCPSCGNAIRAYDNIPILSYVILRGKCRCCQSKISIQYPLVELCTTLFFVFFLYRFQLSFEFVIACIFISLLIAISVIDIQYFIIPNILVFVGLITGLLGAILTAIMKREPTFLIPGIAGTIIGGGIIAVIAWLGRLVFRREAMGMGDVKLMAMIGMYISWWPYREITLLEHLSRSVQLLFIVLFSSALIGAIIGTAAMQARKGESRNVIPYGPFLAAGALLAFLYGEQIWRWYLGFLR